MVISREDLRNEAHGWLKQASNDLSSRFLDFMDKNDTQIDELAQVLDIDVDIMQDILDGDLSQVTAEDLIKLFIANDLAVCVMPVANTPIGRFGQATDTRRCTNMRPDGQRFERFSPTRNVFNDANPMRNNGRNQRPTNRPQDPFNGHEPIAVDAQAPQPRDARGRFISRKTVRNDVREDIQRNQMQEHGNPCPYRRQQTFKPAHHSGCRPDSLFVADGPSATCRPPAAKERAENRGGNHRRQQHGGTAFQRPCRCLRNARRRSP